MYPHYLKSYAMIIMSGAFLFSLSFPINAITDGENFRRVSLLKTNVGHLQELLEKLLAESPTLSNRSLDHRIATDTLKQVNYNIATALQILENSFLNGAMHEENYSSNHWMSSMHLIPVAFAVLSVMQKIINKDQLTSTELLGKLILKASASAFLIEFLIGFASTLTEYISKEIMK